MTLFANEVSTEIKQLNMANQAWVVQKIVNTIHRVNRYPADRLVCFVNTSPLDSDLSCG